MGTLILGGLLAAVWVYLAVEGWRAQRSVPVLREQPDRPAAAGDVAAAWPRVRLVAAARNEAPGLEAAARSWLALDYPALEVVLVDDRSTDQTGAIVERLARTSPRVRGLHVTHLPPGWLGKTHALALGAAEAASEWLVFTDADVRFHPQALRKAIAYATRHGCDHVACLPGGTGGGWWLRSVEALFLLTFVLWVRPHRVANPRHPASVGVGAFNLVRTEAYRAIEGHQRIALRPDDDLTLGLLLKRHGYRQRLVDGAGLLAVTWYPTLRAMARGLEKNIFAGCDYRLGRVGLVVFGVLGLFCAPWAGVVLGHGAARGLFGAAAVTSLLMAGYAASRMLGAWHVALGTPVSALILAYIYIRSVALTLRRGGIVWRESFYPLEELRRNRV
ncbi:MAG TPA: glycosyltransferase [Candidatus Tectomicrobia bacterium]|nr:glycosyltransferase [Candidatus Tectomicrobia bacterium]